MDPVEKQYRVVGPTRFRLLKKQKHWTIWNVLFRRFKHDTALILMPMRLFPVLWQWGHLIWKQSTSKLRLTECMKDASAVRQIRDKKAEERAKTIQAKRQASVVSGGAKSASADVSAKPITSLREAFEAAKRQHA
jgi:hypothetical protein